MSHSKNVLFLIILYVILYLWWQMKWNYWGHVYYFKYLWGMENMYNKFSFGVKVFLVYGEYIECLIMLYPQKYLTQMLV